MNNKKLIWGVVGVVVILVIVILSSRLGNNETGALRIGAIIPLSGTTAFFGTEFKNGFDLANKIYKLDISIEDSKSTPADGVSALQKLIVTNNPDIVIPILSSISAAVTPVALEKKIVVFQSLTSANDIAAQSPYVFRYFTSGAQEAPIMSELASEKLGAKTAYVIYQNDEYGLAYANAFKKDFESRGGSLLSMDGFVRTESDFRGTLTKVKAAKPDFLYVIALDQSLATILKQAKESGVKSKIATNWVLAAPAVIALAGSASEGVYLTSPSYYTAPTPEVERFASDYKAAYGKDPSAYSAIGYDLVDILSRVKKTDGDADHQKLIADITALGGIRGIMGDLKIDAVGEITFALYPAVVEGGKLKLINN